MDTLVVPLDVVQTVVVHLIHVPVAPVVMDVVELVGGLNVAEAVVAHLILVLGVLAVMDVVELVGGLNVVQTVVVRPTYAKTQNQECVLMDAGGGVLELKYANGVGTEYVIMENIGLRV